MTKFSFSDQSPIKQTGIILGLLLIAFAIAAVIGYMCELLVNNGNSELTASLEIKSRSLLGILLIVVSI